MTIKEEFDKKRKLEDSKYCQCCGLKISIIRKALNKRPFNNTSRTWKGHTQFENNAGHIYEGIIVEFCRECGEKLNKKDFKSVSEGRPYGDTTAYENVLVNYTCHSCGHIEEF